MKKFFGFAAFALLAGLFGCADSELDPLQFDKITKGSLICLRGDAVAILNTPANSGAVDTFSLANIGTETFDIKAAYLADDLKSLAEVEYFAKLSADGTRARIGVVPGSDFKSLPAEDKYPLASIQFKASDIMSALGNPTLTPSAGFNVTYIFIEADLKLTDGSVVPASSIVNSSLYETPLFYPAMNLRIKVVN